MHDQELLKIVGGNIRRFRHERVLSQEGLADRSGHHRTYLAGVERGERNASLEALARIARALGVPPMELLRCAK